MTIKLYGFGASRSARCEWTLKELGLEYEFVDVVGSGLIREPEFRAITPYGAMPALQIDGTTLFESAAICTHLADLHPEKGLIHPSGTRERALHDQWVSFALTNMEAWLWSNAKHQRMYPEERRVPAIVAANTEEFRDAAGVLDAVLGSAEYLVGTFSVTDIIVGYTVNWGRKAKLLEDFENLKAYNARLMERECCPFVP